MAISPYQSADTIRAEKIDDAVRYVMDHCEGFTPMQSLDIETDDDLGSGGDLWATVDLRVRLPLSSTNPYRVALDIESYLDSVGSEIVRHVADALRRP